MDTLYPVNQVAGAPEYSGRMLRQAGSVLLAGATSARPLGGRSGVRPGTSTATVTATSTTWTCGAFGGAIDGEAAAEAGPYQFAFDAAATGPVTAANASNPRVDIIYVQVDDPSESDGTAAPVVRRGYLAGVAAATPAAPAPPARSFVVAQINVPKSGGGAPTVSWVAPYAVSAGGILPIDTLANLNTLPGAPGQHAVVYADPTPANNGDFAWDSARWKRVSVALLGVADFPQGLAGVAWTDLCTLTATSNGGMVIADWDAVAFNANSGADRAVSWRALCDGAVIGPVTAAGQTIPLAGTPRVYAGYKARSTPTAGSHTWKVQVIATAASAVFVEFATMTVTEY